MNLRKHIIDTIKEWQLKIGYREGNMKLYYPGESLAALLKLPEDCTESGLAQALAAFCAETESELGRIKITGSYERYCLDIPAKGCAYVAGKIPEPEFLKLFLKVITGPESSMESVRKCFEAYAEKHSTMHREEIIAEKEAEPGHKQHEGEQHSHGGHVFYFNDDTVEEYVYWVEENEFGLTYHRFTKEDYKRIK